MRVELAYGRERLPVELPDDRCTVVEPAFVPGLPDPAGALRRALAEPTAGPPLREVVRPGRTVAISVCDSTRPQPREAMLRAIADELAGIVRDEDVMILIATGTHRPTTDDELVELLGAEAVERFRVLDHDSRDASTHVDLGVMGDGVSVSLASAWVEADVRITTGFVEPHFFV